MTTITEGTVLAGRYRLGRSIGRGGMAEVFTGHDDLLDRPIAVKVPFDMDSENEVKFLREARTAAKVVHPNVVPVYDAGIDDDVRYIVMERMDGGSLRERLDGTPMDVTETARIGAQVAAGLAAAHELGLVHLDVKPANILFNADGDARVADFGIARLQDQTATTVRGSTATVAPEILSGHSPDARSDIYSLGCVLTQMLTGAPPYRGDTPAAIVGQHLHAEIPDLASRRPDVPRGLAELVATCLAKDPELRPPFAADIARDLAVYAEPLGFSELSDDDETLTFTPMEIPLLAETRSNGHPSRHQTANGGFGAVAGPGELVDTGDVPSHDQGTPHEDAAVAGPAVASAADGRGRSALRSGLLIPVAIVVGALVVGLLSSASADSPGEVGSPAEAPSVAGSPVAAEAVDERTQAAAKDAETPAAFDWSQATLEDAFIEFRRRVAKGRDDGHASAEAEQKIEERLDKVVEKTFEDSREDARKALAELREAIDKQHESRGITDGLAERLREAASGIERALGAG